MEFRILGPIEVDDDKSQPISLGGPKPRTLLGGLLLGGGRVVSDTQLVEWMWGENPPSTAPAQIHTYASELRKLLGDTATITRQRPGYRIEINNGRLDLEEFTRLVETKADSPADTADNLRAALGLWRGPALSGGTEFLTDAEQGRLEERRLAVLEDRIEADLALGRHSDLVSELTGLVAEHPLRERMRAQLMLALYRNGRQGDALSVYAEGRRVLAEELGIDPGPQLRKIEEGILAGDPELGAPETPAASITRPAQLPPDVPDFTGRDIQMDQLATLLSAGATDSAVLITALAGMAGVGKTALAVHVAHKIRDHYPDGQLYVDLRGVDSEPLSSADVLARLLHALGVVRIPDGLAERADLYRSRLADRRVLILLDNAASEHQVRPLLPGSSTCAVIVTSRRYLAGLEGARLFDLHVFEPAKAVELLGRIIGPARVAAEPEDAERIVRLCGYLPLAVRIAGARLAARPHWRLTRLAERLADERRRLDELRLGDLEVRASLNLSYEDLDADTRRALRMLGLLDVPHFASWVASAALGVSPERAEDLIEQLVDAQLLEVADSNAHLRYRFHDLIRVLARERANEEDAPDELHAALERAFSGWLTLAEDADARLPSTCLGVVQGSAPRWREADEVRVGDPIEWFETERPCLVAAVGQASAAGLVDYAWEITQTLTDFLDVRGLYDEWRYVHNRALETVREKGDRLGEAVLVRGLAQLGTYTQPPSEYLATAESARDLFAGLGQPVGEADARWLCAQAHLAAGRHDEALACLETSLELSRAAGHRAGEAFAYERLGEVRRDQGRFEEAMRCFEHCLEVWRALGTSRHVALILIDLGLVHHALGQNDESEQRLREALDLFRDLGDRLSEAEAQHSLGELELAHGDPSDAAAQLEQAVALWQDLSLPYREAQTLRLLTQAYDAQNDEKAARTTRQRATRLFEELDMPELAREIAEGI